MSTASTRATYHERIAMRREAVLAVVLRRPGVTTSEVRAELNAEPGIWFGYNAPCDDLRWLERRGKVQSIKVSRATILWHPPTPVEPLLWEGDDS